MPLFSYTAFDAKEKMVEGELEADKEAAVLAYLQKHELFPVSVKQIKRKKGSGWFGFSLFDSVSALDKIILTRNMSLMIKSGISISEAIDIMLEDAQKPILKKILEHSKVTLEKGSQLSDALSAYPRQFSLVIINMLKAGEASGNLESALMSISDQLKKENDLRKKVKSAMAYPAVLVSAALGVVVLLVTVVLPRVGKIFTQSNLKLPLITRILLGVSDFVAQRWYLALLIAIILIVLIYLLKKSNFGRIAFFKIGRRVPVLGELLQKVVLARFNSVLYSLLKSGVPIMRALEITADALDNAVYKKVLLEMTGQEVSKGVSFGMALKRRPEYFPRLTASMIVVGEKSGNLETMLDNLARFYEDSVDDALKTLITLLEPALLLGVGLMVGVLALSIIIPIYQMIGAVR